MRLFGLFGGFFCLRLLCLRSFPAETNAGDLDAGQFPPMADGAVITFAAAIFEGDHFLILALFDDFAGNGRAFDQRAAMGELVAVAMEEDIAENGLLTRITF